MTGTTCVYWAPNYERCLLRETPKHGNILDILTASLILVAVFFDVLVYIFAKGLNLYNCKVTDNNYTPSLYAPVPHEDSSSLPASSLPRGGSPDTATTATGTSGSPMQRRDALAQSHTQTQELRPEAAIFRHPSSLTDSSGAQSIVEPNGSGVTYAQVVFPPDKRKPTDGSTSPKRLAVPANVPLHHLSEADVRTQLGTLKSFNPAKSQPEEQPLQEPPAVGHDVPGNADVVAQQPTVSSSPEPTLYANTTKQQQQQQQDVIRPQSPETDF